MENVKALVFVFFFAPFVALAGSGSALDSEVALRACSENDDCELVREGECGSFRAVHKGMKRAWEKMENELRASKGAKKRHCGKGRVNPPEEEFAARCEGGRCDAFRRPPGIKY